MDLATNTIPSASADRIQLARLAAAIPMLEKEARQLLTTIMGTAQIMSSVLIKSSKDDVLMPLHEWKSYVDILNKASHEFSRLLDQLLDYTMLQQGQLVLASEAVDFTQVLRQMTAIFANKAKEKMVGFDVNYPQLSSPIIVYGDVVRIQQILYNLLENALKFTPTGRIEITAEIVSASSRRQLLEVTISDTGIGIAEERLSHVFEQFTQVYEESDNKGYQGLGLGLMLVKRLLDMQGGDITVNSILGRGTQVQFHLPMSLQITTASRSLEGTHILVVEYDSGLQSKLLQQLIKLGIPCEGLSLQDATYALQQETLQGQPGIVIVMANNVGQRVAHFARTIRTNRQYGETLLVLALSPEKQYEYEKEQALINGYNVVINKMEHEALFMEALAQEWENWVNRGETAMVSRSPDVDNKVLVIEDNLINQKVIRLLLGELGLDVEIAPTGTDALNAIEKNVYSAVFVDIGLPDISGLEVITQLRKRGDSKSKMPVIVLSADGTLSDEQFYKQRGIDAYLVKPLTLQQLRETLIPFFSSLILA